MSLVDPLALSAAASVLQHACHWAAQESGWWGNDLQPDPRSNPLCFSNKLALIHSEISEALEGDRKAKKDEHLPHRDSREVELADAAIRIFDLAGAYGMDLGEAIREKIAYNASRVDHKPSHRVASGGKAY